VGALKRGQAQHRRDTFGMRAWLITWEWIGNHAAVTAPFITILTARKSQSTVADFVEQYYLLASCSAGEIAYFANRPSKLPYRPSRSEIINGVPHGDRIICGHNPYIYARLVSSLIIKTDNKKGLEVISWREPSQYKWKDKRHSGIALAKKGCCYKLVRKIGPSI